MQPMHPQPTSRRPVWLWAGAAAGLGLALSMFFNSSEPRTRPETSRPAPKTIVVTGTVVLRDSASFTRKDYGACAGTGTHADIIDGAPVLITTTRGVAAGKLNRPQVLSDGTCRFWFSVPGVPIEQDSYLIMVADRDPLQYAEQELVGTLVTLRFG